MKHFLFALLVVSAVSPVVQARDFGDHNCNIFIREANNYITGGHGNYYQATVVVKKDLIKRDFNDHPIVAFQYYRNNAWSISLPDYVSESEHANTYHFRLSFGAIYHTDQLPMTAFISNRIDRLFDNNSPGRDMVLTGGNRWRYDSHCSAD